MKKRRNLLILSGIISLSIVTLFHPTAASAVGICDFIGGTAGDLCRAAEQASKERKRKKAEAEAEKKAAAEAEKRAAEEAAAVALAPAQTNAPVPKRSQVRGSAPAPNPNVYRAEKFYGIDVWANAFTKAVNDPAGFKTFLAGLVDSATGTGATVNALATGPQRNFYQKFLTDYQIYGDNFSSVSVLLEKTKQCTAARDYSPAEACDCVAGFPGDTAIGAGAGELVTGSNSAIGIAACGRAAELATNPADKARFIGQRARAQIYTFNTFQAIQWADEAIGMGYRRAAIVKASAALRDFEVRNSGFPAPTPLQNKEIVDIGVGFLKAARTAGVRESYVVSRQFRQTLAIYKFNTAFYAPIFKAMMTPPPAEKAGGCRADGVPCSGEKYDSSGNIVRQ